MSRSDRNGERLYEPSLREFDASAKTREQYRRAVYTTFKIDKIVMPGPAAPCPLGKNSKSKDATLIHRRERVPSASGTMSCLYSLLFGPKIRQECDPATAPPFTELATTCLS